MHPLDPVQVGTRQLAEHPQAKIGDEAMAEIGNGHVGDIFRHGLDDRYEHDRRRDPVDHLRVFGDEHVVGGSLNEERDGAGGRGGQKHGEEGDGKQPEPGPQMLAPDAKGDVLGGIVDLELVGAPRDRSCVPEQMVFQAIPRFWRPSPAGTPRLLARAGRAPEGEKAQALKP